MILPEQDYACVIHGKYRGRPIKTYWAKEFGSQEEQITHPQCPECICEESEKQEKDREKERIEDEKIKWLRKMNIGKKFWESNFSNFNAYNDELKKHKETAMAFASNQEGKLVMIGENGNGKTHLAISVLKIIGGRIYKAYEIGAMIRYSYNSDEIKEWELLEELCTVPLLVIDEVEKIKESEFKNNWMSYIIGRRYDECLPIILIANCHLQEDCTKQNKPCPDCLEYHLENDVISRIIEDGIIMKFNSEDYRRKIREMKFGKNSGE